MFKIIVPASFQKRVKNTIQMSKAQKKKEVGMFNFPKEVSKHCYNSEMWEIKSYFRSLPNKNE